MNDLKFHDVLIRARLSESTAQYVAKSGKLKGMPDGERGKHRVFTLPQALDFALASRLVAAGVKVATAAKVVEFCRRRSDELTKSPTGHRRERCFGSGNWTLEVLDDELVRLWRNDRDFAEHFDPDLCFSIAAAKAVKDFDYPAPISKLVIDLTLLERELGRDR